MGKLIIIAEIRSPKIRSTINKRKQERWSFRRNWDLRWIMKKSMPKHPIADVISINRGRYVL